MPRLEKTRCPFLKNPFDDCYISQMSSGSQYVEKAVDYCGGDYKKCRIYRRGLQTRPQTEGLAATDSGQVVRTES
jgi:hypothetical protein